MLHNISGDLIQVRNEVAASMQETMPAKEFAAELVMAVVGLHQIEARIRTTRNLEERRKLIDEFNSRRKTIEKAIGLLRKSSNGGCKNEGERLRQAAMS
jgi:hypothetical protein